MADIVTLNVGGVIYSSTRATLTRYPDSMLGAMFSGRHDVTKDDQDRCFIDGDGSLFRYVLNFLRRSELALPEDFKELDMLGKEATFYQLQPLVDAIEEAKQERTPERRKIEYLEIRRSSSHFMIRGEKRTHDIIVERLPRGPGSLEIASGLSERAVTKTSSDIVEARLTANFAYNSPANIQVVSRLHNLIFDLGFNLKSSNLNQKDNGWLFERL